jgi:hypothetical protein
VSKFNQVLEKQIEKKAKRTEDQFWSEFEHLLNKYSITNDVKFHGMCGAFKKPEDTRDIEWRDRVKEHFIGIEAQKFTMELGRLESYFLNNSQF